MAINFSERIKANCWLVVRWARSIGDEAGDTGAPTEFAYRTRCSVCRVRVTHQCRAECEHCPAVASSLLIVPHGTVLGCGNRREEQWSHLRGARLIVKSVCYSQLGTFRGESSDGLWQSEVCSNTPVVALDKSYSTDS